MHRRKRRNVLYAPTQRGRHRDDHGPRANGSAVRLHEHSVPFLHDASYGRAQDHAPFQLRGPCGPRPPARRRRTCTPRRRLRSRTAPRSCRRRRCPRARRAARRRGARRRTAIPPRDRSRTCAPSLRVCPSFHVSSVCPSHSAALCAVPGCVRRHVPRELAQGPESPLDLAERAGISERNLAVFVVLRAASAFVENGASGDVGREGLRRRLRRPGRGCDAGSVRSTARPARRCTPPTLPAFVRPPTLSWASITITEAPAASSFLAAVSPASPAPTIAASTAASSGVGPSVIRPPRSAVPCLHPSPCARVPILAAAGL